MYYFSYKPLTYGFACLLLLLNMVIAARGIDRYLFDLQPFDQAVKKQIRKIVWGVLGVAYLFVLAIMGFVYYFT
jgi:hypothetical protein